MVKHKDIWMLAGTIYEDGLNKKTLSTSQHWVEKKTHN